MKKYLIRYNSGYGDVFETEVFDTQGHAENHAYEQWRDAVETQVDYDAQELNAELAYENDIDPDELNDEQRAIYDAEYGE